MPQGCKMKGLIMRTGRASRRNRILQSLPPERRDRILELKTRIEEDRYPIEGRLELVVDELIDEAVQSRN